jgi:hypothetical protein
MDEKELLWHQYETSIETYKHYLKLAIELNAFYYAITGAIVSYYLAHAAQPLMRFALLLPVAMSFLFGGLLAYGAVLNGITRQNVFSLRDKLGLEVSPELAILTALLAVMALLMLLVAIGLLVLFCTH